MSAQKSSEGSPAPGELAAFLKDHPWPPDWAALGDTLEWFWAFELRNPPGALWERLSDTSAFNFRLGLPAMTFEEKGGRLYGRSKNLGLSQEWEEVPWEWTWGRGLSNARIYSRGWPSWYVRATNWSRPQTEAPASKCISAGFPARF